MSFGRSQGHISPDEYGTSDPRRSTTFPNRLEDPSSRHVPSPGLNVSERTPNSYASFPLQQRGIRDLWTQQETTSLQQDPTSPWPGSPLVGQFPNQSTMSSVSGPSPRSGYGGLAGSWPGPMLRRTSSDDTSLSQYGGMYYGGDASNSSTAGSRSYPQRRPSNRDEFDGPSQLLDRPEDVAYEPREEDLPKLPVTLYAQEQDEILSKVNDRLSKCAFHFVAKYQFPIPIEPDKRPVCVPSDREWSEWVYLLKRLATKRRIPSRVLYNGQIKQLITILENSLEMRHAAKHQSRPLKDDRNILQLISSGLQVAKIVKDAPAMQYLDSLYVQTERLIHGRRATAQSMFGSANAM
ncbi:hypothetical protein LTR37_016382 [Vermiconidia calcicola]|uniref:Uncharacterized protein n=1 Tax=Vermiconidia calcicola TaxID=1690605 RepID=A0ACC3MMX2_9PEZI|nr:hypothetical protein LTR37_016382 [Vermiconidia calcicola]